MPACVIKHCKTKSQSKDRSLFEIKGEDRQRWKSMIQEHQKIDEKKSIYICDLHFNRNDLVQNGKSLRPKKNILPFLSICNVGTIDTDLEDENTCPINILSDEISSVSGVDNLSEDPSLEILQPKALHDVTCSTVSIPMEVYKRLCQDSIDLIRAKRTVDKLTDMLQKKEAKINELKVQKLKAHLSPAQDELLRTLMYRSSNDRTKYSPAIRDFCFRIHFYSSSAYKELRTFFDNRLPTVRTLRKWLRCVEVGPGISEIALNALAEKAKSYKDEGNQLHLCLISDEMGMRKQVTWNANTESFDGFATTVNSQSKPDSRLPLVKDALVFMAVGPDFKIAVGYFLLNGLQATDRAVLNLEVIKSIDSTGAKVISVTGDGLYANKAVAELLGADFKSNKPFFPRPSTPNEKIYIIFDPPHMLKLVRKYLSEHQLYYKGNEIRWDLLIKLAEKQDKDNFELGNKLTKRHINWKQAPMVVRLAAETLSNSVADTLEQLNEDNYDDFIGCAELVKFIRLHNNVFDFLNYGEGKNSDDHFKNSLCESNIDKFIALSNEYKEFVSNLEIDQASGKKNKKRTIKKKVLSSKSSMGFFGFWHNLTSAIEIYYDYVQSGSLKKFDNFQFSQDHLETFFSLVRSSLGSNNNPNTEQFKSAYKKLLICTPNLSAKGTNCIISATNLLTVSSAHTPTKTPAIHQAQLPEEVSSAIERIQSGMDYNSLINQEMDDYERHTHAYLASIIETNVTKNMKNRSLTECMDCLNIFSENNKFNDSFLKKKGQSKHISQPCSSTVEIVMASSTIMKNLQSVTHIHFNIMLNAILSCLDIDLLYDRSNFNDHENHDVQSNSLESLEHKDQFIRKILREYLHIKSRKICNRVTAEEHKAGNIRKRNTKNIIFAGQ